MEKNSYMMNPYVEQMEKFGKSLEHLADTFFQDGREKRTVYIRGGGGDVLQSLWAVCKNCENRSGVLVKIRYGQSNLYMKF